MAGIDNSDPEDLNGHSGDENAEPFGDLHFDPNADPLPDFLDRFAGRCRGILIPFAAQVYLIVQIGSLQLAAEYFSGRFGRRFSTRPIRDVVDKIERGIIPLSREQILEAAELHRVAKAYVDNAPWAIDPKEAAKIDPVSPRRKPGRPPKSGKTTNEAAEEPARKTTGAEENLHKEPTNTNGGLAGKSAESDEISGENPAQSRTGSGTESGAESGRKAAESGAVLVTKPAQTEQDSEQQPDQNRSGSEGIGAEKPAGSVTNPEKNPAISDQIGDRNDDNPPQGRGPTPAQVRELRLSKSGTGGVIDEKKREEQLAIAARMRARREARRNKTTSAD